MPVFINSDKVGISVKVQDGEDLCLVTCSPMRYVDVDREHVAEKLSHMLCAAYDVEVIADEEIAEYDFSGYSPMEGSTVYEQDIDDADPVDPIEEGEGTEDPVLPGVEDTGDQDEVPVVEVEKVVPKTRVKPKVQGKGRK